MKSRCLVLPVTAGALAFVMAAAAPAQPASWREVIPRSELREQFRGAEIHSVDFLTRHTGWAVGKSAVATMIFRTNDGGRSWYRLTLYDGAGGTDYKAIRFADANNGWIAGKNVLRTTDGGATWTPLEVPAPGWGVAANTMLVMGPDAVMIGSNSTNGRQIRVTTDGGRSWLVSTVSPHGNDDVVDLAFVPPATFFAVTASSYRNRGGIYRSDDGGRNWTPVVQGQSPLHALAFSGRRGVAAGAGVAYWTEDGGDTWNRVVAAGTRHTVRFLDANTVIALGEQPEMLVSGNSGRSWAPGAGPQTTARLGRLVDVAVVDPGWWFVAGGYGANAVFHYNDPSYAAPVASGTLVLPRALKAPGGQALPPGSYRVSLRHRGHGHAIGLRLSEPAPGVKTGVRNGSGENEFACDPCEADFPVEVDYDKQALEGKDAESFFKLALEPTPQGVELVLEAAVTTPRDMSVALAALGAPAEAEMETSAAPRARTGGGLLGRARRAAAGDVRGAVAGAPSEAQAAAARARDAAEAQPAIYRIRVRHALDLLGEAVSGP